MNKVVVYSLIYLFGIIISAFSQVLLKKSASGEQKSFIKEYLNIKVILAYFIFFLATFCSIYAYKVIPITLGALLGTLEYVFVCFLDIIFFKETISYRTIIGIVLIIVGIICYSL